MSTKQVNEAGEKVALALAVVIITCLSAVLVALTYAGVRAILN